MPDGLRELVVATAIRTYFIHVCEVYSVTLYYAVILHVSDVEVSIGVAYARWIIELVISTA